MQQSKVKLNHRSRILVFQQQTTYACMSSGVRLVLSAVNMRELGTASYRSLRIHTFIADRNHRLETVSISRCDCLLHGKNLLLYLARDQFSGCRIIRMLRLWDSGVHGKNLVACFLQKGQSWHEVCCRPLFSRTCFEERLTGIWHLHFKSDQIIADQKA